MTTPTIQQSVQYLQAGDLDRAEQSLRHLLQQDSGNIQGWCLLGSIRQARGRPDEAIPLFQQAAKLAPQDAAIYNLAGAAFVQLHDGGQAVAILEQALKLNAFFPDAYNNLGKAYLLQKNEEQAMACFREAIHLKPSFVEAINNLALLLIARKQLGEARTILEQALPSAPQSGVLLVSLSVLHLEQGENAKALGLAQTAVQLEPYSALAQGQLGATLLKMSRPEEALGPLQLAVQLSPNHRQANEHLSMALLALRRADEAAVVLRRLVQMDPNNGRAHVYLSKLLFEQGKWTDMIQVAGRAVQLEPNAPDVFTNLGLAYLNIRQPHQALVPLEKALQLKPDAPEALCLLGWALTDTGNYQRSVEVLERCLKLKPDFAEAYNNLGLAQNRMGKFDESVASYEACLRLKPDMMAGLGGIALSLMALGRHAEAIPYFKKCMARDPKQSSMYSNMLFSLHSVADLTAEEIYQEHLTWARHNATPPAEVRPYANVVDPQRRLRIGYVSADFREHVMGWFIEPILAARDRANFEVYLYANQKANDTGTERIAALADQWRSLYNVADDAAEEMIRTDQIDLLVDLGNHTADNRLSLFGRKPAPVQATLLGLQFTTGTTAIDYRITDAGCDPPGMTEAINSEQLYRLPEISLCYKNPLGLAVNDLPALALDRVTFGSFNTFNKITDAAIAVWSKILRRLPTARLLLLAHISPQADRRLLEKFASHGIEADRLLLMGKMGRVEYQRLYHQVDIALDPFPYTGYFTSCDAMWMGVPLVTLAGRSGMARQGASLLAHLGLPDLIASTPEEYADKAVELARDLPRLVHLRTTLRDRMSHSTLMNPARYTRQLEEAYRWMWRQWCQAQSAVGRKQ
jgi:predicted O-linked N-acetylglucosamine transferase (SPINDLY family)